MSLNVNVNGIWKTPTPYVNVGGVWKKCSAVYANVGGAWKKVYPVTAESLTKIVFGYYKISGNDFYVYATNSSGGTIELLVHFPSTISFISEGYESSLTNYYITIKCGDGYYYHIRPVYPPTSSYPNVVYKSTSSVESNSTGRVSTTNFTTVEFSVS